MGTAKRYCNQKQKAPAKRLVLFSNSEENPDLPAGFRHPGNHAGRGEFTESEAGNLEAAHESMTAATHAAAIHQAGRARITGKLAEGRIVFLCFQLRTEFSILFHCFAFALIALEP